MERQCGVITSFKGASGGLGIFWLNKNFTLIEEIKIESWIMVFLEEKEIGNRVPYINVYGPVLHSNEEKFWVSLEGLKERNLHINSVMGREFNMVLNALEKRGGSSGKD